MAPEIRRSGIRGRWPRTRAKVLVAAPSGVVKATWRKDGHMNIWEAAMLLAGLTIIAIAIVIITGMALRDTASQDRAGILRAIAELVRELRP
jgi:hypothetical protein